MIKIILTIAIVIACIVVRVIWSSRNKKNDIQQYQEIPSSNEIIYIQDTILKLISCNKDDIKEYVKSNPFYELFKEDCVHYLTDRIIGIVNNAGTSWASNTISKDELIADAVSVIRHSKDIDKELYNIYAHTIRMNIEEGEKLESEAIDYNSKFDEGNSSDSELHPIEPKNGEFESDEITEKSIEELLSTGTVEDIEED